jgi:hypothetical protein
MGRGYICKDIIFKYRVNIMIDWRNDPATEAQKKRMHEDGIKFSKEITKGEASDLIGSLLPPGEEQDEVLKFFKVKGISQLSQTSAQQKIDEIFNNPDNDVKWRSRPASKEQKVIYTFFKIPIPPKISHEEAQKNIDKLFEDENKHNAWENRQEEMEEKEGWFEDYYKIINDDHYYFGYKKIGKKLFKQAVEELEFSGISKSDIENNFELVFKKAVEIDPTIKKESESKAKEVNYSKNKTTQNKGCLIILFFLFLTPLIILFTS